jgi:hypothetical protein
MNTTTDKENLLEPGENEKKPIESTTESLKGLSLAEVFAKSPYGTYGNAKMKPLVITGAAQPKPSQSEQEKK